MAAKRKTCLAGHENCEKCSMHCCAITPARGAEIATQASSRTNWAEASHPGAACQCGLRAAKGVCHRHGRK